MSHLVISALHALNECTLYVAFCGLDTRFIRLFKHGRSQEFTKGGGQNGSLGTEDPSEVQGQSPVDVWCEAGYTYGCRLYRNTLKNTKHTNM